MINSLRPKIRTFILIPLILGFALPIEADPLKNVINHMLKSGTRDGIKNNISKGKYQLILLTPSGPQPLWAELSKSECIKRGERWKNKKAYLNKKYRCREIINGKKL